MTEAPMSVAEIIARAEELMGKQLTVACCLLRAESITRGYFIVEYMDGEELRDINKRRFDLHTETIALDIRVDFWPKLNEVLIGEWMGSFYSFREPLVITGTLVPSPTPEFTLCITAFTRVVVPHNRSVRADGTVRWSKEAQVDFSPS